MASEEVRALSASELESRAFEWTDWPFNDFIAGAVNIGVRGHRIVGGMPRERMQAWIAPPARIFR